MPDLLLDEYREIIEYLKRTGMRELEETRGERLSPIQQRLGMKSPAIGKMEDVAIRDLVKFLTGKRAELGVTQLGRKQYVEDVAGQREYQTRATAKDWAERYRTAGIAFERQEKLASTAFKREKELIEERREYEEERISKAEKKASLKDWIKMGLSAGLGAITGGLAPAALGVGATGLKGFLGGAFRGGMIGAPGIAQIGAQQAMMQPFMSFLKQNQQLQPSGYQGLFSSMFGKGLESTSFGPRTNQTSKLGLSGLPEFMKTWRYS